MYIQKIGYKANGVFPGIPLWGKEENQSEGLFSLHERDVKQF